MSLAAISPGGPFSDLLFDDGPFDDAGRSSESDSWLMSYLDMLMLLITFFVLMLALYGGQLVDRDLETPAVTALPLQIPATRPPAPLPAATVGEFYRPPRQLAPAPLASDAGFYSPGPAAAPEKRVATVPMVFSVPLFDLPDPTPAAALPQIDGVEITAIPHGFNLRIQDHLLFDSSAVGLSDNGRQLVERLIPTLQAFKGTISVEGHTDSVPISTSRFPSNWELSAARASAVVRVLRLAGIDGDRLRAIGYASTHPLASNHTPAGRASNRRVELVLQEPDSPTP
ncbi:MAG: flagellar motor protein MotB [Salinicola sp.]|uniref:OmpA family protein n=1 Tax=uncultured Salinicola sp. TaxID=1193542 RepID=UPI000C90A077|nr:OmpA family protein [uncultured Salinicola sp.]MAM57728.1 flagellar motor protein MotB [Salinicola sp.]